MTVFVGAAGAEQLHTPPGGMSSLLSFIVSPNHDKLNSFNDRYFEVAAKHRPMEGEFHHDENTCVVACGRLDKFSSHEPIGALAQVQNSAKLIAIAYEKWGEALVNHICGEFAFAIWDRRKRVLICARDRFGQMPFAYAELGGKIVFGTDFLAVAMGTSTSLAVNEAWVIGFIKGAVLDQESTPFKGVKKLPPASLLKWKDGDISIRSYWSFSEVEGANDKVKLSHVLESLRETIEARIINSNTGVLLSGGLDSSSIAVLARDHLNSQFGSALPSVSIVFDDYPEETERPYIESVLAQGGFLAHLENFREYDAVSSIKKLVRVQGGPSNLLGVPSIEQALSVFQEKSISTVLDGHGGDEVISSLGAMRLFELAGSGEWFKLMRELRVLSNYLEINPIKSFLELYGSKGQSRIAKLCLKLLWKAKSFRLENDRPSLLSPALSQHESVESADRLAKKWSRSRYVNERAFREFVLSTPLQSQSFEILHRVYRSRGIRPQYPFWDFSVVKYCMQVPSDQKLKNGVPRSLIRSVMGDRLPELVSRRASKGGFSNAHIRSFRSSAEKIRRYGADTNHEAFQFVSHRVFSDAISDLFHERPKINREAHSKVWITLNLILWLDMVADLQSQKKDSPRL